VVRHMRSTDKLLDVRSPRVPRRLVYPGRQSGKCVFIDDGPRVEVRRFCNLDVDRGSLGSCSKGVPCTMSVSQGELWKFSSRADHVCPSLNIPGSGKFAAITGPLIDRLVCRVNVDASIPNGSEALKSMKSIESHSRRCID